MGAIAEFGGMGILGQGNQEFIALYMVGILGRPDPGPRNQTTQYTQTSHFL
jgi:hypothetical protein